MTLYVFPEEETEEIDVAKEWGAFAGFKKRSLQLKSELKDISENFGEQINVSTKFSIHA